MSRSFFWFCPLIAFIAYGAISHGQDLPKLGPAAYRLTTENPIFALGDIHGSLDKTIDALVAARLIDGQLKWVGGSKILVQVGDQLDRGPDDKAVLHWLSELARQAKADGGMVVPLIGNHEVMNSRGDFRYSNDDDLHERKREFAPKGALGKLLSEFPVAIVINKILFVHADLNEDLYPKAGSLSLANEQSKAWFDGSGRLPYFLKDPSGPVWSRRLGSELTEKICAEISKELTDRDLQAIVVGHTPQEKGINGGCPNSKGVNQVWRIDVGMTFGLPAQILKIDGDRFEVLTNP